MARIPFFVKKRSLANHNMPLSRESQRCHMPLPSPLCTQLLVQTVEKSISGSYPQFFFTLAPSYVWEEYVEGLTHLGCLGHPTGDCLQPRMASALSHLLATIAKKNVQKGHVLPDHASLRLPNTRTRFRVGALKNLNKLQRVRLSIESKGLVNRCACNLLELGQTSGSNPASSGEEKHISCRMRKAQIIGRH